MYKGKHDTWFFTGTKTSYGTLIAAAAASSNAVDPPFTTDIPTSTHGMLAGSLIYIQGTTNYDGLRKILSVPDSASMVIYAKFVAETFSTGDTWKTMYSSPHPFEFLGFEFHSTAAIANVENLIINIDAAAGAAYDKKIYQKAMNGVQSIDNMFDAPRQCMGGDKIDVVFPNAGSKTWGIKLYTRRTG